MHTAMFLSTIGHAPVHGFGKSTPRLSRIASHAADWSKSRHLSKFPSWLSNSQSLWGWGVVIILAFQRNTYAYLGGKSIARTSPRTAYTLAILPWLTFAHYMSWELRTLSKMRKMLLLLCAKGNKLPLFRGKAAGDTYLPLIHFSYTYSYKFIHSHPHLHLYTYILTRSVNIIFLRFSNGTPPRILQSDNGPEYTGKNLLKQLCDSFGVMLVRARPHHPQSNGLLQNVTLYQHQLIVFFWRCDWALQWHYGSSLYAWSVS